MNIKNYISNYFTMLVIERIFHGICMGSATLLPFYFLENGLNEVYFGLISLTGGIVAVIIILLIPFIARGMPVEKLALASGIFLMGGYSLLLFGNTEKNYLYFIGFVSFPLISAGWVAHFTLSTIKVSQISSDSKRQQNFMIYAAFSTLGISLGPVIGRIILSFSDNFAYLFGALIFFALMGFVASFATGGIHTDTASADPGLDGHGTIRPVVLTVPASFFLVLTFFQIGIFTVIINFQVVFSVQNGLNSSIFFLCWAFGIMAPRLILGGWLAKLNNRLVLPLLTTFQGLSLFALAAGPPSNFLYGCVAVFLGVFYGLSYPIIQAEIVRYATLATRRSFLFAFSLVYFISFYGTPLVAGFIVYIQGYHQLYFVAGIIALAMTIAEIIFYRPRHLKQRG